VSDNQGTRADGDDGSRPEAAASEETDAYRIVVDAAGEDPAVAALWEAGTQGIEVQADGDQLVLLAYFPRGATSCARLREVLAAVELRAVDVPAVDWLARFREGFASFEAAGFRVVPAWQAPATRDPRVLVVDPGRAFGTGTHESTRLCLGAIAELARAGRARRVLDLGAGTGLLGIAAARLGAPMVVALDNDPEAVAASRHHAELNGVVLALVRGDGGGALRPGSFDLLLANLATPFLLRRREELVGLLAPGGVAVLSGLLANDQPEVARAYAAFGTIQARRDGEWAALVLTIP
jgi:ribosomal protein L11 methyltransferase